LSDRFATVSRARLLPDLLIPLRNALGNAWKHGNRGDPAKTVVVDMLLTCKGALLDITDEGSGFDVARTYQSYQEQQSYFKNHGCGFRNLDRAMSTVSYENAGRTLLLCYRPPTNSHSSVRPAQGHAPEDLSPRPITPDLLEWSELGEGGGRLEACCVYRIGLRGSRGCGYRYALRVTHPESGVIETRLLTGRVHAAEDAARADFGAAARLYAAKLPTRVRIPRPVARVTSEPRLVLYDFGPWMNLGEYLACRRRIRSVRHASERLGQTLAALHKSRVAVPGIKSGDAGEALERTIARAETTLRT